MAMLAEWWLAPSESRPRSLFRHSARDAWLIGVTLAQTLATLAAFTLLPPLAAALSFAVGICWCSNTVSHNHLHNPLFRSRRANRALDLWLSLLLGVPQTIWKARHVWHHAGEPAHALFIEPRPRQLAPNVDRAHGLEPLSPIPLEPDDVAPGLLSQADPRQFPRTGLHRVGKGGIASLAQALHQDLRAFAEFVFDRLVEPVVAPPMRLAVKPEPLVLAPARADPVGRHVAGGFPEAVAHIVARQDELRPIAANAADDHMGMRVVGVVVVDGEPIELHAEVALYPRHRLARELFQLPVLGH